MRTSITTLLLVLVVLCVSASVSSADEQHVTQTGEIGEQVTGKQAAEREPVKPTEEQISKAYMNCLIEVDKTLSVLAGNTNLKAVRSEAESQRAFCVNRKRDCVTGPTSSECQTFIDEFKHTELTEQSPGAGKHDAGALRRLR
jgi:hypothetical protein